jgi:hypothetical protein
MTSPWVTMGPSHGRAEAGDLTRPLGVLQGEPADMTCLVQVSPGWWYTYPSEKYELG